VIAAKSNRCFPRLQHNEKVGGVVLQVLPTHKLQHLFVPKITHAELEDGKADYQNVFLVPVLMSEAMVRIFFSSASQYYVARKVRRLRRVAANLMHH
jgi:hypothetical protein